MREFDIDLTEYINKGIVPNELRISKQPGLSDCKELVITPQGLKPRPAIFALDADYGVFADYPYPLLFNSINDILISTDSALFNYDSEEQIINNPAKELVDFTDFLIANSTNSMYEFTSIDGAYISPDGPTELTFTSLCKYNDAQCLGVNGDTVYWSKIGLVDFTIDHSNIAGKIRLPFPGEGLKIMQLSNHILCYGDEGVFALTPVQQPAGTWRKVNIPLLAGIGIKNAEAVCDVGDSHIFIGNDENLWKIDSELKITKLGYDYLIKELDTPHCVFVSHYNWITLKIMQ